MSSQVCQIIGHEKQRAFLSKQFEVNKLKSPFLFYGPDGIGKRLVVYDLIEQIKRQNLHVDCTEFIPESKTESYTLEQIDAFIQEVKIKPFDKTLRVFIFDQAHKFGPVQANALLKTLEELDTSVLVFFITHNIAQVLNTVRSRCTSLCFHALDEQSICKIVDQRLDKHILKRASGSVKVAQLLMDSDFLEAQNAFMIAITTLYSNRFDQLNPLLDQMQKILSQKPRDWIEYLLESLCYFQMDRIKYKHKIHDFTFQENEDVYKQLQDVELIKPEILRDKITKLVGHYDMGLSVKYIIEHALFSLLLK